MSQTLQNQILMTKSMNGIISLSDGAGSTITNGTIVTGNITGSSAVVGNLTISNTNITGSIDLQPSTSTITINNYGFQTPARAVNTIATISFPYTVITGWSISLFSGTAPTVYQGRGFTSTVNTYETLFPEYPYFTQYLSFQGTPAYQMNVTQTLNFPTTGNYILTFYGWGEYNRYVPSNTISVTCGNNSISGITLVEQAWKKIVMKFQITTAGNNTLTISVINQGTNSGLSISGFKIQKQVGLIVYDGTNANNQLITPTGLYTSGFICNQGKIQNFGSFDNYGPLGLNLAYSKGSLVIGSSAFGSFNASDTGSYNIIIGQSNIVSSPNTACNVQGCIAIGYAALEQGGGAAGGLLRCTGIGYQANRWNNLNCNDNCCIGYQSGQGLGYSGVSSQRNVALGNFTLVGGYANGCNDNTVIGNNSMGGASFTNARSYNSCIGGLSMSSIFSNYNSCLGYGSANSILNTSSNYNTFVGAQVCPTQSGSANVLLNCTFLGSASDVSTAGNYSNSTCVGYNSRITGNNQIILGTSTETTYTMGGLNIPVSTVLTLIGNISANSLIITPAQLSFLNQVVSNKIPSSVISDIANYLTTASASATYQTILSLINKLQTNFVQYLYCDIPTNNVCLGTAGIPGQYNTNIGVDAGLLIASNNNTFVGYQAGSSTYTGGTNTAVGSNSLYSNTTGTGNSVLGYYTGTNIEANDNTIIGANSCNSAITNTNCSSLGSNCTISNSINYCTIIGSGANGTTSNSIILGRNTDITYAMGGLNIPASTELTLLGNISSNSLTITPAQLSFLNQVVSNQIPSSVISDIANYPNITGLNKLTGTFGSTGGSLTLAFGDPQYLIFSASPIITGIGLPNPTLTSNIGARFSLVNALGNVSSRTVSPPAGQFIWDFNSNTSYTSFSMDGIGVVELVCVNISSSSTTTWAIINRGDNLLVRGTVAQTITGVKTFNATGGVTCTAVGGLNCTQSPIIKNQYYNSANYITANHSIGTTIYPVYAINITANITITLPTASVNYDGAEVVFRRTGGTITATVVSASSNIYNATNTLTNSILISGQYIQRICCMTRTSGTYAWFYV
jgi:hypothetical protein